jgi:hypothetical protein
MSVSITSPVYYASGPISFRSLRDTFRQTSGTVKASELYRNEDITSTSPIVPDATENLVIPALPVESETNWSASAFRNSVKYYEATQTGTDDNTSYSTKPGFRMGLYDAGDGTGIQWNGNLSRNISKVVKITGTCGSKYTNQAGAQLAAEVPVYNFIVDVTGGIYGAGGAGGTLAAQGTPIRSTIAAQFYYIGNQLYLECTGAGSATVRVSLQVRDVGFTASTNGYPFSNITLNSQSGATGHNIQISSVAGTRFSPGYSQASYDVNFDLPVVAGNYAISITSINSLRKSDNSTLNNGERVSTVRMIDNGPTTTILFGKLVRTIPQGYALLYTNGITQNLYTPGSQSSAEIASGQPGGTALKIQTTSKVTVNVGGSGKIYGGGGGGEAGANGASGTVSDGACKDSYQTSNCGSTIDCAPGFSQSNQTGGCCFYRIAIIKADCMRNQQYANCSYSGNATFPTGGTGGAAGLGQGYGQARTDGTGGTGGSCPTCPKVGGRQTKLSGYYTCGTKGTDGGNGGDWGSPGANTTNAGSGGLAGPAITGTFNVTGTVTTNTVRGALTSS